MAGHITGKGDTRSTYEILAKNLKGKDHLEDLDVNERVVMKRILKK
jgi:hypothetical protein